MTPSEFAKRIDEAIKVIKGDMLLNKVVLIALGYVQKRARVRTGTLRRSLTTRVERNLAFVGTTVEYARYQPEPFMELGLEDAQGDIKQALKDWGDDVWAEVAK